LREQEVAIATREGEFNALQIQTACCTRKSKRWFLKSKASRRRSRKARRNAMRWQRS